MNNYDRMLVLAGLQPRVIEEGAVNDNMSRYGLKDPTEVNQSAARLFGLYVGLRGSGELRLQFTGDRSECLSQWHDDLKRDYNRGEAVARVVPVHDNTPDVIAESFECEDSEDIVMEAEDVVVEAEEAKVEDKAPALDTKEEKKVSTVKVPADVTSAINSRIAELKQSIAQYNDKGYDDGGVKPNAIDALEQIAADLKLEDGLTKANIFYGTLMSPITDLFPPKVVKFLHTAPKAVKEGMAEQWHELFYIYPAGTDPNNIPGDWDAVTPQPDGTVAVVWNVPTEILSNPSELRNACRERGIPPGFKKGGPSRDG